MFKRLILAVYLVGAATAPAFAQTALHPGQSAHAAPVRYADLDLRRAEDAQMLLSRLRYAAWVVCARTEVSGRSSVVRAETACAAEALANAVARIDAPELTRLHAEQGGR